jgi:hypothetical protein
MHPALFLFLEHHFLSLKIHHTRSSLSSSSSNSQASPLQVAFNSNPIQISIDEYQLHFLQNFISSVMNLLSSITISQKISENKNILKVENSEDKNIKENESSENEIIEENKVIEENKS